MAIGTRTDSSIKAEIIDKIRNHGMSVSEAADTYHVNAKTIYYWLRSNVVDSDKKPHPRVEPLAQGERASCRAARKGHGRTESPKILAVLDEVDAGWRSHFASCPGSR